MATIKARLDKAARNWAALRETVDGRNVTILHRAGLNADMPIAEYPADVLGYLAVSGWTAQKAHDLLQRWQNERDENTVVILRWGESYEWEEGTPAPSLVIDADLWDKLKADAPGDELLPDAPAAPDAPETPKEDYTGYVYRRERETRRPFPHELAERRQRPRWTTR